MHAVRTQCKHFARVAVREGFPASWGNPTLPKNRRLTFADFANLFCRFVGALDFADLFLCLVGFLDFADLFCRVVLGSRGT